MNVIGGSGAAWKDRRMRIYVSGPMRSQPDMGRHAFAEAGELIRGHGHEVYVPTEQPAADAVDGERVREALAENLVWLCRNADGVVVLPGWPESRGARAEVASAWALDIPVWPLKQFLAAGPGAMPITSERAAHSEAALPAHGDSGIAAAEGSVAADCDYPAPLSEGLRQDRQLSGHPLPGRAAGAPPRHGPGRP